MATEHPVPPDELAAVPELTDVATPDDLYTLHPALPTRAFEEVDGRLYYAAEVTGLSTGAVESKLFRARARLRQQLLKSPIR